MFTKVIQPFGFLKKQNQNQTTIKLFTLRLSNVENCFDARSLWDHRYGSSKEITDKISGKSNFRLKKALDIYRITTNSSIDGKWMLKTMKVFTDIILWIPETNWQDDIEVGANNIAMLADTLAQFHTDDFKEDLFAEKKPNYVVMPDPLLKSNEVIFQFGMGVYVPKLDEEPVAQIEIRMENQKRWGQLQQWIFWKDSQLIKKPAGIYKNQQGIIFGREHDFAAVKTREKQGDISWFSHSKGAIFINYALKDMNYAFGDGKYITRNCEIDSQNDNKKQIIFRFKDLYQSSNDVSVNDTDVDSVENPQVLFLKITEFENNKDEVSKPVEKGEPSNFHDEPEQTVDESPVEQGTIILEEQPKAFETIVIGPESFAAEVDSPFMDTPHMFLEGYALPRIDKFKIPGLEGWEIWLAKNGKVFDSSISSSAENILVISAKNSVKGLYARYPQKRESVLIDEFPKVFDMGNDIVYEMVSVSENNYYNGAVQIPKPDMFFPLDENSITLGRGEFADIKMDLLTNPDFLLWEEGKKKEQANIGIINLSREHAKLRLYNENLEVENISKTSPLFILRQDDTLDIIKRDSSLDEIKEKSIMEPGERLIMGCCLLRFENENFIKNDDKFTITDFLEKIDYPDRLKSHEVQNNLAEDKSNITNKMSNIAQKHKFIKDISTISPEDYIKDLDTIENFLKISKGTDSEIKEIKQAKIDYLNRY